MSGQPWLWLIAGPNGAGKSTYAPNLAAEVDEIVRPDEIAASLAGRLGAVTNVAAGRIAIARTYTLLREKRSFAIETTLAGRRYLELVRRAKAEEWKVGIVYI